jgi:hypothetical protein
VGIIRQRFPEDGIITPVGEDFDYVVVLFDGLDGLLRFQLLWQKGWISDGCAIGIDAKCTR